MAKFCIDCGVDISCLHHRANLCLACRVLRRRKNAAAHRERRRTAKVCPICGKSLAGQTGQRIYCTKCRPYVQSEKPDDEPLDEREARISAKLAKEKERTAMVLASLDDSLARRSRPSVLGDGARVVREVEERTGYAVEWRGMRCVTGGHPQQKP